MFTNKFTKDFDDIDFTEGLQTDKNFVLEYDNSQFRETTSTLDALKETLTHFQMSNNTTLNDLIYRNSLNEGIDDEEE